MALGHWQANAVDQSGNVLAAASVTVRYETSGLLATIKSDRDGLVAKSNPFTTDVDGYFDFYAVSGAYRVTVSNGSFSRTWRYVAVGTAAELDANDLTALLADFSYFRQTTTDPSLLLAGEFCGSNANLASSTALYFNAIDANVVDQRARLLTLDDSSSSVKGTLVLRDALANGISFSVSAVIDLATESPADNVLRIDVTFLSGTDIFASGEQVFLDFSRTGDMGTGATDGDKVDISVSGNTWTINPGVVTTSKMGGDVTSAGKALLDDVDAAAQRVTLGLQIGVDVQAKIAEADMDRIIGWDDSSPGNVVAFALADMTTESSPAAGDYLLIYGAEGDLRRANWNTLPGSNPNALLSNATATLTAGFQTTSYSIGTVTGSNQSISPNEDNGQHQHCTLNGSSLTGTLTLNPPNASTQVVLEVTNGGSGAVAATLSVAATKTDGTWVSTNGSKFLFILTKTQTYSHCQIVPLQ